MNSLKESQIIAITDYNEVLLLNALYCQVTP